MSANIVYPIFDISGINVITDIAKLKKREDLVYDYEVSYQEEFRNKNHFIPAHINISMKLLLYLSF